MEKEIDKNSKENKGKVTKKVCKTIDNKMIKFYTTMQQRWKKYIEILSFNRINYWIDLVWSI